MALTFVVQQPIAPKRFTHEMMQEVAVKGVGDRVRHLLIFTFFDANKEAAVDHSSFHQLLLRVCSRHDMVPQPAEREREREGEREGERERESVLRERERI